MHFPLHSPVPLSAAQHSTSSKSPASREAGSPRLSGGRVAAPPLGPRRMPPLHVLSPTGRRLSAPPLILLLLLLAGLASSTASDPRTAAAAGWRGRRLSHQQGSLAETQAAAASPSRPLVAYSAAVAAWPPPGGSPVTLEGEFQAHSVCALKPSRWQRIRASRGPGCNSRP